jgi:hypothetical protein
MGAILERELPPLLRFTCRLSSERAMVILARKPQATETFAATVAHGV